MKNINNNVIDIHRVLMQKFITSKFIIFNTIIFNQSCFNPRDQFNIFL